MWANSIPDGLREPKSCWIKVFENSRRKRRGPCSNLSPHLGIAEIQRSLPCSAKKNWQGKLSCSSARIGIRPLCRHFKRGCCRSEERRVGKEGRSRWSPYH